MSACLVDNVSFAHLLWVIPAQHIQRLILLAVVETVNKSSAPSSQGATRTCVPVFAPGALAKIAYTAPSVLSLASSLPWIVCCLSVAQFLSRRIRLGEAVCFWSVPAGDLILSSMW